MTDFDLTKGAKSEQEAEARAKAFRYHDPLAEQEIPPALLSSNHFIAYIKATALIHPFYEEKGRIKAASYEVRAAGNTIRWDAEGKKVVTPITDDAPIFLPKNSITFIQIESKIRLPQYIAIRFNLRISHVHRGLLLGTGPLIDPEFDGEILIPIHNLTDEDYHVSRAEGLIWVEFTKTSAPPDPNRDFKLEPRKNALTATDYLERANKNNAIRSSLEGVLVEAKSRAVAAEASAKEAQAWIEKITTIGIVGAVIATVTIVLALHSYFGTMITMAGTVQDKASSAVAKVESLASRTDDDRKSIDEAKKSIEEARKSTEDSKRTIEESKRSLESANRELETLRQEISVLKAANEIRQQKKGRAKANNARQVRGGRR